MPLRARLSDYRVNPAFGYPEAPPTPDNPLGLVKDKTAYPIYVFQPDQGCVTPIGVDPYMARLVDVQPVTFKDGNGNVTSVQQVPVYATLSRDCCQGDPTPIPETATCYPPVGAPKQFLCSLAVLDTQNGDLNPFGPFSQHCFWPQCRPVYLNYAGNGTWKGVYALAAGNLTLTLTCVSYNVLFGATFWNLTVTDCDGNIITVGNYESCHIPMMTEFIVHDFMNCCCGAGNSTNEYLLVFSVLGTCKPRYLARLIDHHKTLNKPIFAWSNTCGQRSVSPPCCNRLPCTMVATLSGVPCLEGFVVTLKYEPFGVTSACTAERAGWISPMYHLCGSGSFQVILCCRNSATPGECGADGYKGCDSRAYNPGDIYVFLNSNETGSHQGIYSGLCQCSNDQGEVIDFKVQIPVLTGDHGNPPNNLFSMPPLSPLDPTYTITAHITQ
jgi:hypothetical protein